MPSVSLATTSGLISGWFADPVGIAHGNLVIVQEIFGVNSHIRAVTERFAEQGFRAIAPALFDQVEAGVELGYDAAGIARGRELVTEVGVDRAVAAIRAAKDALASFGKVGVVGFCWGGTLAFLANTRLGMPSVSYYGARTVPYLHELPRAPMLFHFGERDSSIPAADIQRHRDALPQAQVHVYPAGHGFNCDQRGDFDAEASALAFERTLAFFGQALR
jgi:carboxymethylenebutenolidase